MKKQGIIWFVLLMQAVLFFCPILTVFAYELPYQQPQYKPYDPKIKPYIPKGVELEEKKEKEKKPSEKQSEGFDVISWGNGGIYTQVLWNVFGDVIPAIMGRNYVHNNRLLKVIKANNRGDVRIVGTKQPPYWTTRWKWLVSGDHTIGKFDLGKWYYNKVLLGFHNRLTSYGFLDLVRGKRYTQEEFNKSAYNQVSAKFSRQMGLRELLKSTYIEGSNTFKESFLIFSSQTRQVAWWKFTGSVGLGFSAFVTTMDYTVGSNKDETIISSKYLAALPVDFAVGALVGISSSILTAAAASLGAFILGISIPAIAFIITTLVVGFFMGLYVGNNKAAKAVVDKVHDHLTWVVSRSFRIMTYPNRIIANGTHKLLGNLQKAVKKFFK
ncbi:hypothetical protein [Shimazuella kribbensis]|uniref:hypothetical protein n=1 Tax=Shimazuella kribbensis TaxID=139808 RepID=UPI0003FF07F1|nr:hypothetical protein [Shimazuella kribbensis]